MKIRRLGILCGTGALMLAFALSGCANSSGNAPAADGAQVSAAAEGSAAVEGSASSAEAETAQQTEAALKDGTYVATFQTDHAMFHVNEANNDKGILTVENGQMTIHVSLQSKRIVNLFAGTKEDAQKDGAQLLMPTTDTVTYDDGTTSEVYGFDIPVPALDTEFDVALVGTKGKWYDHKVVVSDPVEGDDLHAGSEMDLEDGEYQVEVEKTGGSGRATVESPTKLVVEDGKATLTVTWSSPHYDYMIVDGEKYLPVNEEGNSVFEIPVDKLNEPVRVTADTTAMSTPHEIDYKLTVRLAEEN